jgi:hypothetical protein
MPKTRRPPYGVLPDAARKNGYVSDLVDAVTTVAKEHGAKVGFHKKNGDYYIAVLVPTAQELDDMERRLPITEGEARRPVLFGVVVPDA